MGLLDRLAAGLVGGEPLTDEVREQIDLALALAERGDLVAAEERLAAVAEAHPRGLAVRIAQGEVRARRGDHEGAVEAYGRAVDLSVDAVDAWLGLGEALVRLGRGDPAADAFRRVLSASDDPARRARAHAGRGRLALASGRIAKAVRELRKAAELLPDDAGVAADLGRALIAAREPDGWQWLLRAAQANVSAAAERPADLDVELVVEAGRASPRRDAAEALVRAALERAGAGTGRARLQAALAEQLVRASSATLSAAPFLPARFPAGTDEQPGKPEARIAEATNLAATAMAAAPADVMVIQAWQAIAEATGDCREALRAAARAGELGAPAAPEVIVRVALGAADREEMARASTMLPGEHPLARAIRAFLDGSATEEDLGRLGAAAPSEEARRFVARAVSPGAPPEGNLFALLAYARDLAARSPELAPLLPAAAHAAEAVDRPLLVAVMGEFNAGKSSFVNALCGDEVAPVGVTPTTATINVLRHGPPGGRVLYQDGRARDLGAAEVSDFLGGLADAEAAAVRLVEIFVPVDVLRRVEIVDTPGLNSLRPEHERVARAFLTDADAIVWLFAVGQAAKATERDALGLAHDAGKRVLGVLNKADQSTPEELAQVREHVAQAVGDRIEVLLPLSARDAVRARRRGDPAALEASGMTAVVAALEERFFGEARALKRRTALSALARFVAEALALSSSAGGHGGAAAEDPAAALRRDDALDAQRAALDGALAAERVTLRGRLEHAFRQAAGEVLEFVRPRRWPFGERRAEAADEEFLFDLLEDAVAQATEATRVALEAAAQGGPPVPVAAAIERFRAYARGVLAGGLVKQFLHEELPAASRVERVALERALVRRVPDVDAELIAPLAAEVDATHAAARAALREERAYAEFRRLLREERLIAPTAALAAAVRGLEDRSSE